MLAFLKSGGCLPPLAQYHGLSAPPRGSNVSRVAPASDLRGWDTLYSYNVTLCNACVTLVLRSVFHSVTLCHSLLVVLTEKRILKKQA